MKLIRKIKTIDADPAEALAQKLGEAISKATAEFSKPAPSVSAMKAIANDIVALTAKKAALKG